MIGVPKAPSPASLVMLFYHILSKMYVGQEGDWQNLEENSLECDMEPMIYLL